MTGVPSQITLAIGDSRTESETSVAVNWVTTPDVESSQVIYSRNEDLSGGTTVDAEMLSVDSYADTVKPIHAFRAVMDSLTPGKTYYYAVGNETDGFSSVALFTAPEASENKEPFSFLISADTQGEDAASYQNTEVLYDYLAEEESDAAFLIHTGDVVEDANISNEWYYFFDAAEDLLRVMPIMATPGNHDAGSHDTEIRQFRSRFDYTSLTAPAGLSAADRGTVYSFAYGDALMICLNSYLEDEADEALQWKFLEEQCASTDKAWKIVYYHEATYDPGASHYQLDNEVGKHMTDAGVDLVLNGHEHAYARTTVKTTSTDGGTAGMERAQPGQAPTYVIGGSVYNYAYSLSASDTSWNDVFYDLRIDKTGTGGGKIYSPGVYGKVEVSSNALTYSAYYKATGEENDFRTIDTFTLRKDGAEITQPTGTGAAPRSVTYLWDSFEQDDGQFSGRFNWITDTDVTGSQMFYAKKADFDANGGKFTNMVLGSSKVVDLSEQLASMNYTGGTANYGGADGAKYCYAAVRSHKAETPALEPDTEYVYCVGDGRANTTSVSEPQVIKTPAADTDSFDFLFFTDAQQGACGSYEATLDAYSADMGQMLDRATEDYPDAAFLLSIGDQVNYGIDTWEWDAFFANSQDVFSKYPFYLTTGNHECDGAGNEWTTTGGDWTPVDQSCSAVLGRYNPPENGAAYYGGGEDGTARMTSGVAKLEAMAGNYYFIYGDTLFLVMDYQDSTLGELTGAQQQWMQSVVKNNPTKWRVAVMHKTLFGYRVSDPSTGVYRTWTDAFDNAGIDLVLMGHDHVYARTKYYAEGAVTESQEAGSGTTYITGASANEDNRSGNYKEKPYTEVHSTTNYGRAYVAISVSPEAIKVTTKGIENDQVTTVENNALITDTPRTYDLSDWQYPSVPEETDDLSVTGVSLTGYAKEGQTLTAKPVPASANVAYQWEISNDQSTWTAIDGATSANYVVRSGNVGAYLRCAVTGTGFYHGTAVSDGTGKITSLSGGSAVIQLHNSDDFEAFVKGFGTDAYPMDGNYELTAPIDMTGKTLQPIGGSEATPLLGTFNGGGYAISNLTIASDAENMGLFAFVGANGRVVNVNLKNVTVTGSTSSKNTGAVAGACAGTIENCSVTGSVSGDAYTAVLVGRLHGGTVQNCMVDAAVNGKNGGGLIGGTNFGGAITGKNDKTGNVVKNNLVLGSVTGTSYTGAVVGDMGGSSGCPLQTFTGNAINASVTANTSNCIAGYWSGSRPILDADPLNYAAEALTKDGISGSNSTAQNAFVSQPASAFSEKATYEALGWDFDTAWAWDDTVNHPVPKALKVESGDGLLTIVATAGNGGTISPEGYVLVHSGEEQTFSFQAKNYFVIDSVKIDGVENAEAAEAGSYTFENVTALHKIEVTFRLADAASGVAPSLISASAYYNKTQKDHINLLVNFGEGALGILEDKRHCVAGAKIVKGDQLIFDCSSCFWFPSHGAPDEPPENMLQICYDDMQKKPEYSNLVPGVYDLAITFKDLQSTVCTIPLTVVEKAVHQLTVTDAVLTADGAESETTSKIAEDTLVTVTPTVPAGKTFAGWTITGLEGMDASQNPLTFQMPQNDVAVAASFHSASSSSGSSGSSSPAYSITAEKAANGAISISPKTAKKGDTVTVAATADNGYTVASLTVTDQNGKTVTVTDKGSGKFTFTMPAGKVTVTASFLKAETPAGSAFTDVSDSYWALDAITWAKESGYISGNSATTFHPSGAVTRQQLWMILARCAGLHPADMAEAKAWAIQTGISDGSTPGGNVSRQQMVAILYRYTQMMGYDVSRTAALTSFPDAGSVSGYAQTPMAWSVANGIVGGTAQGTLNPAGTVTRAQFAAILMRFHENFVKE